MRLSRLGQLPLRSPRGFPDTVPQGGAGSTSGGWLPDRPKHLRALAATAAVVGGLLGAGTSGLRGEETPTLGLGVPSDAIFFAHARVTDRWDPLRKGLSDLGEALARARLVDEILRAIVEPSFGDEERDAVETEVRLWKDILGRIEWGELFAREVAFALRFDFPRYDLLALFRVSPGRRLAVMNGLQGALESLSAVGDDLEVQRGEIDGVQRVVVRSVSQPEAELCLGGLEDVVAISTSSRLIRLSLQMLQGRSSGTALLVDPDYRGRPLELASEQDFQILVRPSLYFEQLRALRSALAEESGDSPTALAATQIVQQLDAVVGALDVVDWAGLAGRFGGGALRGRAEIVLTPDANQRTIYPAFGTFPPLEAADRRMPRNARVFLAWSGLDLLELWNGVREGMSPEALGLGDLVGRLAAWLEVSPLGESVVSVLKQLRGRVLLWARPAPIASSGDRGRDDVVLRAEVREEETTARSLQACARRLEERGVPGEVERGPDGVRFTLDFLPGRGARVLVGLRGKQLVLASSPSALERAKPSGGDAPAPEGLAGLGLSTDGPVLWLSYAEFEAVLPWVRGALETSARLLGRGAGRGDDADRPSSPGVLERLAEAVDALRFLGRCGFRMERVRSGCRGSWALEFREGTSGTAPRKAF